MNPISLPSPVRRNPGPSKILVRRGLYIEFLGSDDSLLCIVDSDGVPATGSGTYAASCIGAMLFGVPVDVLLPPGQGARHAARMIEAYAGGECYAVRHPEEQSLPVIFAAGYSNYYVLENAQTLSEFGDECKQCHGKFSSLRKAIDLLTNGAIENRHKRVLGKKMVCSYDCAKESAEDIVFQERVRFAERSRCNRDRKKKNEYRESRRRARRTSSTLDAILFELELELSMQGSLLNGTTGLYPGN